MKSYPYQKGYMIPVDRPMERNKGCVAFTHLGQLVQSEGLFWLEEGRLDDAAKSLLSEERRDGEQILQQGNGVLVNLQWGNIAQWKKRLEQEWPKKNRVHLMALGDVGSTVLTALKLLGGDCIHTLGIFDVNEAVCRRWECELNQAAYPWEYDRLPEVVMIKEDELFDCDMFVFCASKGIPPVGKEGGDVRMAQFEANREIISHFAKIARETSFQGLFAVVSDPVDPLCKAAFLASNEGEMGIFDGKGLHPEQIQGYGLGVMNARGAYYAKKETSFSSFLTEGRAFGPHGQDLVLANSIVAYDDEISRELSRLAVEANLRTRDLGFKPYVAPAISSAAISLILTLQGEWHYSSNFLGGIFMGCKNRTTAFGLEMEHLRLPDSLYRRLKKAYQGLEEIL